MTEPRSELSVKQQAEFDQVRKTFDQVVLLPQDAPTLMDAILQADSTCVEFDPFRTNILNGRTS